jgi:hypothetical protein
MNDIEDQMYEEWKEIYDAIKKGKKQSGTKREHQRASPKRIPTKAGRSYFIRSEAKKR